MPSMDSPVEGASRRSGEHHRPPLQRAHRKECIQGERLDEIAPEMEFERTRKLGDTQKNETASDPDDTGDTCAVCLEPFENSTLTRALPCHHVYHSSCIEQWLSRHVNCPLCNLNLLEARVPENASNDVQTATEPGVEPTARAELSEIVVEAPPSGPFQLSAATTGNEQYPVSATMPPDPSMAMRAEGKGNNNEKGAVDGDAEKL
eukprot:CAMPEP_0185856872 /NCGR_PEP_ID=MMETSP1354-20130828/29218_1 /TAXON_ID=708628 /ORGANISM="Erythrolobus madagascarensis, Strain CCMP3276" /LENGTH=204 /DNA_ID=CAMNT_0028559133 /DNA_START=249 /DNA_END=863 /DNA_ORIENTATION=+